MLFKMFTIFDQKAKAHLPPFMLPQVGQAIRHFTDTINDPKSVMGKHPEDYTLLEIGLFDDEKGRVLPHDKPELIGSGTQYVQIQTPSLEQLEQLDNIKSLTG